MAKTSSAPLTLGLALLTLAALPTAAQAQAQPAPAAAPAYPQGEGYLTAEEIPDARQFLPPAPQAGSPAKAADIAAFRETRKLQGTPRWELARIDASEPGILDDMTCAIGARLTPKNAPVLYGMIPRLGKDVSHTTNLPKDDYKQVRPFIYLGDKDAICTEDKREGLRKSYSYPSGHTAWGWTFGLILAEAAPDKASAILARARAFGESRVVCGVHWASDVSEGRVNAAGLVSVLHANPQFAADLAEAKLEIAAARKAQGATPAGDPARCAMEAEASARTPWTR
jgi:acid phosphatase (class A)